MRYLLIIAVIFMSCEGPVGPQGLAGTDGVSGQDGEQGLQGEPGPGTRTVMSGPVASDEMFITIDGLTETDLPVMDVFICPPAFACLPLPFTVFIDGVASFTANFQPTNTGTWLFNAKLLYEAVGTTSATYVIVMVE